MYKTKTGQRQVPLCNTSDTSTAAVTMANIICLTQANVKKYISIQFTSKDPTAVKTLTVT